jgi:hypothetical protein
MTVCIAAICEGGIIFGAADRMKTAMDVQFEPPIPKIFPITNSIIAMTAGDALFQREILGSVFSIVNAQIDKDPQNWWKISDVAELHARFYSIGKQKQAENAILVPLGLDREKFLSCQHAMSNDFINSIKNQILNFKMPHTLSIITGVDNEGTHIYAVENEKVYCWDTIGFASIGSGSRHAESQFMLAGHSRISPLPESLLLTYSAKKRAEVAPGVGCYTDMFMVGPSLGSFTEINIKTMTKLEEEYQKMLSAEKNAQISAKKGITEYVKELKKASTQQEQKSPSAEPEESVIKPSSNKDL